MNQLQKLTNQIRLSLFAILLVNDGVIFYGWYASRHGHGLPTNYIELAVAIIAFLFAVLVVIPAGSFLVQPVRMLWQSILHITPDGADRVAAPKAASIRLGKELVDNLMRHVYQIANVADKVDGRDAETLRLGNNPIAASLPLPLFALNPDKQIVFTNEAAAQYVGIAQADMLHQDIYSILDLAFSDEQTLDRWLEHTAKNTVTATRLWERVRLDEPAETKIKSKFLDLAVYYNKSNPDGYEILLALFDHTKTYAADENSLSFVSLAVHEMRTPLTLLRGYAEALEEDLAGKLAAEDADFLQKIKVAGQQLAKLITNVLNVARIEDDQFVIKLNAEDWSEIVTSAVQDMTLRAGLHDITIETELAPHLPKVAVDRTSVYEVLSNLLDNAIKYSPDGSKITIKTRLQDDDSVETTVQDRGIGIPASLVPNLFEKFYRSHRSKAQVSGTGLGLYLSKTIVKAHGGHIWVSSHEGKGTTFGFTLARYDKLPDQTGDNQPEVRKPQSWIKNHSLYRN